LFIQEKKYLPCRTLKYLTAANSTDKALAKAHSLWLDRNQGGLLEAFLLARDASPMRIARWFQISGATVVLYGRFFFNVTERLTYFWPAYPKNKPLAFVDYPFAIHLFNIQVGGFTVIRGSHQISKSTSFACREQMVARMLPGFRSLYITPRRDQLQTYQNKFRDLEKANRF